MTYEKEFVKPSYHVPMHGRRLVNAGGLQQAVCVCSFIQVPVTWAAAACDAARGRCNSHPSSRVDLDHSSARARESALPPRAHLTHNKKNIKTDLHVFMRLMLVCFFRTSILIRQYRAR